MSISVPARGWYAEVEHPSTSHVWTPTIVDVQRQPQANDYQRIRITVPKTDHWQNLVDNNPTQSIPLRVWYDGTRQPIDELEDVEDTEGETVLIGRGGLELSDRVTIEVDEKEHHEVAKDIIQNQTPYSANVDTPTTTTFATDNVVQDLDTNTEFEDGTSLADDEPMFTENGKLKQSKCVWHSEAENGSVNTGSGVISDSKYSNGEAVEFTAAGGNISFTFTPDHDVPAKDVRVVFMGEVDSFDGSIDYVLDGNRNFLFSAGGSTNEFAFDRDPSINLEAGTSYTYKIEADTVNSGSFIVDTYWVLDTGDRFGGFNINEPSPFNFSNQAASAPEFYPDTYTVEFVTASVVGSIIEADLDVTMNDTSNGQAIALSFDRGATWNETSNTTAITESPSFSVNAKARITFSRFTSDSSTTPTNGDSGQTVDSLKIKTDQEDMPILVDQRFDDDARTVLQEIAEDGDFLFAYTVDAQGNGTIEWTQPGQRTAADAPTVVDFQTERVTSDVNQKAVVKGSSQRRRDERFTSDHGNSVDLDRDELQVGKEVVYDPSDGTQYEYLKDYDMDFGAGTITTKSTGAMADSTEFAIDYSWIPVGSYTEQGVGSPSDETVEKIASLATERGCEQVAFRIVDQVQDPLVEAVVTAPSELGWSVVEAIDISELPVDGALEVRGIENTPEETVFRLGTRERLGEFVSRIERRLSQLSGRI